MQFIIFLPLPIPGAVHSLVLLFLALCLGFVKLEHIKDVAHFLISIMPILFCGSRGGYRGILGFDQ